MPATAYSNTDTLESIGRRTSVVTVATLGMVAAALGTFLAVEFVPDDPTPRGALFVSALTMSLGLLAVPVLSTFRNPRSLLRTEHIVVMAPVYWLLLDLLQGSNGLTGVQPDQVSHAFIAIGLFVIAVWAAGLSSAWRFPRSFVQSVSHEFPVKIDFVLCIVAFGFGMLTFAIPTQFNLVTMISYLGDNRWAAPWARGQLGGWDAFADQLQYFGYLLPVLTVVIGRKAGWLDTRTLASAAMTTVMMTFLAQSGSRRIVGVTFGMALIVWLLTEKRLRAKQFLAAAIAAATLLFALQVMLEYRNKGFSALTQRSDFDPIVAEESIRVDDNFYRLCQLIDLIPDQHPHTYFDYVAWIIVRPIPRVFWPGKPVGPGFDLPTVLGMQGVSLSVSVVGELYMAAGFLGVALGGWFYGKLATMARHLITLRPTFGALMVYAILTMSLFAGERSMLDLVLINYALLAWAAISRLVIYLTRTGDS